MSSSARRRAWAPPSRRLPVVTATLALLIAPVAASASGVGTSGAPTSGTATDEVEDEAGLRVVLDSVSPVVLRPGRAATLKGRVVNDSPTTAHLSGVTLAASTSTLGSRKEVADWVEGGVDRTTDWVLGEDSVGPLVPAQGEVGFSFTVPGSQLEELPAGPAAVAVRITAGVEGDGSGREGAEGEGTELRTVLTSSDGEAVDVPLAMSWVVPLTLPPDPDLVNPDPEAHAQAWLRAVGPESTARTWVDRLDLPDVTWLVDPALLVAHRPEPSVASATPDEGEADEGDGGGDEGDGGGAEDQGNGDGGGDEGDGGGTGDGSDDTDETTGSDASEQPEDTEVEPTGPVAVPPPTDDVPGTQPPDDATGTEPPPGDAPAEPEEPADQVEQALTALRERLAATPEEGLWWLPTGDPDLARLISGDDALPADRVEGLLSRSVPGDPVPAAVTELLGRGRSHVLWPALAAPTSDDLRRILELHPTDAGGTRPEVVVVPRESFTASSAVEPRRGAVPVDDTDVLALGADSWTTSLVAGGSAEAQDRGAGAAAQHLLAHTLGTWLESPTDERELVVAPPRGTVPTPAVLDQLSRAWSDAGWLSTVPAEEVLDRAESDEGAGDEGADDEDTDDGGAGDIGGVTLTGTPPQELVIGERTTLLLPANSPVDASRGRDLTSLADDLDGLAEILRDTDALRSWDSALDGLWSTRWREDPEEWPVTWRALRTDVREAREAVHVAASNVNFIADQGTVHLTVVNDLPVAVDRVQLAVTASNGRLQILRQPEPVSIGPGSRASVPFDARAVTRGEVALGVALSAPDGTELGVDEQIAVRVQPTGVWIYWVLGGLASIILVLGLARALRPLRGASGGHGAQGEHGEHGAHGEQSAPASGAAYPEPGPSTAAGEEDPG